MASVYLKGKTWYARYKDASGRWGAKALRAHFRAEALRLAVDLERKAERQRFGLEPIPADCSLTLWELCEWWLQNRCPPSSLSRERYRLERHIGRTDLGKIVLSLVSANRIEQRLREMDRDGLRPSYVNGLRTVLHTVYSKARRAGLWQGLNPVMDVERRKVPKVVRPTLKAEEVPIVLAHVPAAWRNEFATVLYTGMRKGEVLGLRRGDVDLKEKTLTVSRSYDRQTTKGGHSDRLPIADALLPYLEDALARSTTELVFPGPDGKMRTHEADPPKILRSALVRAGIVEGYDHKCRRCKRLGRPHVWRHPDGGERRCPACNMRLWPSGIPRQMRFHDLRHTVCTLLFKAGVDPHRTQRMLRQGDIRTTIAIYTHLETEDLREAINKLPNLTDLPEPAVPSVDQHERQAVGAPFVTRLLPGAEPLKSTASRASKAAAKSTDWKERETGFEPATLSLGS
jgi:integrase